MTAIVAFDLDRLQNHEDINSSGQSPVVSYWTAENHRADTGNTYLRLEEWMKDLEEYVLPVRHTASSINLTLEMGRAILKYREELKMFAAIYNQDHPNRLLDAMDDITFLQERHERIKNEWPLGKETCFWWQSLTDLMAKIDEAIQNIKQKENEAETESNAAGIFIKLSVRSPKDSASLTNSYRQHLRDYMKQTSIPPDSSFALSDDVAAIRYANWQSTCCQTSEEALLLLVRSDRIYMDIQHHELYCDEGEKEKSFHLELHVSKFFQEFDPAYEFRGFVSQGQRTSLTIYNPWVYDEKLIKQEADVLQRMLTLWDEVTPKIRSQNYSLDFAFSKDLQNCWIIELNNFLPPLAGSGLFKYYEERDKEIILQGPFEFRIRKTPVVVEDFSYERIEKTTGKTYKVIMQPASDEIMLFVKNLRLEKFGLPLVDVHQALKKKTSQPYAQHGDRDVVEKRKSCIIA